MNIACYELHHDVHIGNIETIKCHCALSPNKKITNSPSCNSAEFVLKHITLGSFIPQNKMMTQKAANQHLKII